MKLRLLLISTPVAALALAGCGGGGSVPSNAVAVVHKCNTTITKNDFNQLLYQTRTNYKKNSQKFPEPGTQDYKALQNQIVSYLVLRAGYVCEGKKMGIDVSNKDVDKRIDDTVKQYFKGKHDKYVAALKTQGVAEEQYRRELEMQLYEQKIFQQVTKSVKVTDKDIQDYYNKNKQTYTTPATRTVRHILVKKKSLANSLYSALKNGASFTNLVKKYSKDPGSKKTGGKLVNLAQGQTVPAFDKVAFELKTKQISSPVHTQFGWHIIQALTPVKPKNVSTLAQVKAQIRETVAQSKKTEAGQQWSAKFRADLAKTSAVAYQAGYQPPTPTTTSSSQ